MRFLTFLLLFVSCLTSYSQDVIAQTNGLSYQIYAAGGAQPSYTQDVNGNITNRTLLSTGTVSTVNYNWGENYVLNSNRAEGVIVRFYGYINIPTSGTYYFGGNADDGIRINVNNISVVNSWIESGGAFRSGSVNLSAGVVPIELIYYENSGGAMVNLQWYQNNVWQVVPTTSIATTSNYLQPVVTVNITTTQTNQKNSARARQTLANQVNIDQIGSYNNVDVIQSGTYHLVDVNIDGDNNDISISQYGIRNYSKVSAAGSGNTTNVYQTNSGGASVAGQFSSTTINGNTNTVNVTQNDDGEKQSFVVIDGNSNIITNNQFGTASKYSDIKATGNGHTISLDQKDGGSHAARIEVTNSGGSSNVNVIQQGNTNQTYLLQQSCATVGGCSVSITQQ